MPDWRARAERRARQAQEMEDAYAKQREAAEQHAAYYSDIVEVLDKLGLDPQRLKEFLEGLQ